MPIEKEFKYILLNSEKVEVAALKAAEHVQYIRQGYLGKGARVRAMQEISRKGKLLGKPEYVFTFKHDLSGGRGIMEIEKSITKADFEMLWSDTSQRIVKTRHDIPFGEHVWELDCLKDGGGETYLVLAECEVQPGEPRPTKLPPVVERNLIYPVAENDERFTNRKLSDRSYAHGLIEQVTKVVSLDRLRVS